MFRRASEGFRATLFAVKPDEFANTLLHATGSKAHLDKLEEVARKRKLKLTEHGMQKLAAQKSAARLIRVKTESEIYKHLGMQYVPPELREDQGEIEAALEHELPEDLITAEDIRGMVHCHTK